MPWLISTGTVLTSPTIYISYDLLYASDSCGAVGKTFSNTILPLLDPNHLFSLEANIVELQMDVGYLTSSFNFADLNEPVADSVYNRQSRCKVDYLSYIQSPGVGNFSSFSCRRYAPYAPIIGVPPEARALDPAWASCGAWYGGLFDREYLPFGVLFAW